MMSFPASPSTDVTACSMSKEMLHLGSAVGTMHINAAVLSFLSQDAWFCLLPGMCWHGYMATLVESNSAAANCADCACVMAEDACGLLM